MTGREETKKSFTPGFISEDMQFIADAMLGRLARLLRFLGFIVGPFSAGDVTIVPYKQIVISAGEGAKAALAARDFLIESSQL